jgi:thioesterase domain-containing protein/acyl carrier protein
VPVRLRLKGEEEFAELCRRCHAAILDASGSAAVGIEELAGELGLARDPARAPLAGVFTFVREYAPGELKFGGAAVDYHAVARRGVLAELDLSATEAPDHLVLTAHGNADLASQNWLDAFVRELGDLIAESSAAEGGSGAVRAMAGAAAPKDALERYLAEVWEQTLGVPEVGAETSFYELGGHSLLAVQVFNELHQKFKVRLPLAALVEHETVRKLAAHLRAVADIPEEAVKPAEAPQSAQEPKPSSAAKPAQDRKPAEARRAKGPAWNTVVALQPAGDLPPLFCVAGLGGNPMNLRHLAAGLGKRQPFYALQHRCVDGALRPHATIEDMAAEFVADVRRVRPSGPYYLGGFSFGGLAAYEMALHLLARGEQVGALVLLDSSNPSVLKWKLKDRFLGHWARLVEEGPTYVRERVKGHLRDRRNRCELVERARAAEKDPFTYRLDLVTEVSNQAELRYVPKPLYADVVLIKSEFWASTGSGIGYPPHESNGWRTLIAPGRLDIRKVRCSHLDMVAPAFAGETSQRISDGLAALRARASPARTQVRAAR